MIERLLRQCLCLAFFCLTFLSVQAQQAPVRKDSTSTDSSVQSFVAKMQANAKIFAKESAADFAADKAAMAQNRTFEEIKKAMQKAKSYLRTSIDTNRIESGIKLIEEDFILAGDGVLTNRGSAQTFRNLTATSKITAELLSKALERKVMLDQRQQQLQTFRYQLDSLLSVPALFQFPTDSMLLVKYIQQIRVMNYDVHPVDSMLKQTSIKTQTLLNQTNMLVFKLQTALEEIALYKNDLAGSSFKKEFEYLWNPALSYRPFGEILAQARAKAWLTLVFYLENNVGKLLILALIVLSSFLYLRSLKNIYRENDLLIKNFEGQLVLRYPIFSSILLSVNIFQFIFLSPPFILNVVFWTISCICLSMLFLKFISRYWMRVWLLMVLLFLITAFDNIILQASRTERWMMLPLAFVGMLSGIVILWKGNREELREKMILIAIAFMAVLEFGSVIANGFGRYNLAKTLLISGYLNVVVAILFLWTIRLINEGLLLAFSVYTRQDKKLFYLNFDKVGKKVPAPFYVLLIIGWVILFGRNFAGFDYLSGPFRNFFESERTLGSYTFSINSLVLFFVIMGIAVVVSKIVSFFASDGHLVQSKEEKNAKQGIGSWLLLVRITILSIGLFLAIAAAGIPIDKITIVLGALGVGIGFGLQTMVNHLVSGLIIAFEKPVNVGDIVDVDGQAGTMKSIGFRSSVITTWDGADVVMPNGDLLNSHLVNWSLGGNRKRVSISIGIDYEADLEMVKKLLLDLLNEEPRILKKSPPFVQYEQFGTSTIDIRLFFWAKDFREANTVKSDLIVAITAAFRTQGIKIPFPQHDIHIQGKGLTDEKKP